jgi:hypothetical protein
MPAMEYYCFFMELFFVGHAARQVEPNLHMYNPQKYTTQTCLPSEAEIKSKGNLVILTHL